MAVLDPLFVFEKKCRNREATELCVGERFFPCSALRGGTQQTEQEDLRYALE